MSTWAFTQIAYNSCRNRHCPKCQGAAAKDWLEARQAELLDAPYFHVVFTLPKPIASACASSALLQCIGSSVMETAEHRGSIRPSVAGSHTTARLWSCDAAV
jgi:hypothetical protein